MKTFRFSRLAGGATLLAAAVGLATADIVTEPERTIGLGSLLWGAGLFVPDGQHIATITEADAVLWDKQTGEVVGRVGAWCGEQSVAFSPDGKLLVAAFRYRARDHTSDTGATTLWDTDNGRFVRAMVGHCDQTTAIAFSANGSKVVAGCIDGTVIVWDVTTGARLYTLAAHGAPVGAIHFSPDDAMILTSSSGDRNPGGPTGNAKLWSAQTGALIRTLKRSVGECCQSAQFIRNGSQVVTSTSGAIEFWDVATGKLLSTVQSVCVLDRQFTPDGSRFLAVDCLDEALSLFDTASLQVLRTFPGSNPTLSPDGSEVLTLDRANQTVNRWNANTGDLLQSYAGHEKRIIGFVLSPDGKSLVAGHSVKWAWSQFTQWDFQTGRRLRAFSPEIAGGSPALPVFSPDGSTILTGHGDGRVRLWDAGTGNLRRVVEADPSFFVFHLEFSPDGSRFLSVSSSPTAPAAPSVVRVWTTSSGELLREMEASHATFSPDGLMMLTEDASGVTLRDAATMNEVSRLAGERSIRTFPRVSPFSADGSLLLTEPVDTVRSVWLRRSFDGALVRTFTPEADRSRTVRLSPDGSRIVTAAEGIATIWNAATGEVVRRVVLKDELIRTVVFSPDSSRIAIEGSAGSASVWDARLGLELRVFAGRSITQNFYPRAPKAGFTPDGTEIVTGSCSGALLVWDISDVSLPGHFIDSAQKIECCAFDVAVGDLDGDADLDLWIAGYRYQDSREDRVWLNGGEGIFRDSGQTLGGLSSRDVELGDLDGDGDLDAWVVSDGVSRVWSNNGAGVFTDGREQLQTNVTRVALGDVDGDGDLDAWLAISGGEFGLGAPNRVLLNDGTGKFTDSGQALGNSYSADVKLGDLDGDRDLDAFVANSGYTNPPDEPRRYLDRVWINDGRGRFTDSGQSLEGIPSFSYRVALGDLDGDGDLDAWVTQLTGSTIWLNNGAGNFSESPETVPTGENENIDLGDLDGDGDLDAWTGGWGSDQIWINDGNARFRDSGQDLGGYSRRGATALGDFDRDGDLDAWVSRSTFAKVWLNGEVPRIKIKKTGNQIIIDYIGTLERSETVNGQYGLVEGAYSPYSTEPIGPARFFRAR